MPNVANSLAKLVGRAPDYAELNGMLAQAGRNVELAAALLSQLMRTWPDGREKRVELNAQALMSSYCDGRAGTMYLVTVKDISPGGGVCVLQPDPMKRDEQFLLQIPRQQGKPLMLICTVADCRPLDDGNFRIGARFEARLLPEPGTGLENAGLIGKLFRWISRRRAA